MKNIMLGILLCLLWVRGMANQGNEVFLDDPSDITVFEGDEAVFSCVTTDELIIWRVNGTDINDLPSETQDKLVADSNTAATALDFFTLTIPGSVEFNGTRVQCVTTHGSIESMSATLYIQGSLSSVMDVNVSSDGTSVTIAWTAPFSLDVTNVDPDIWYSVLIYNVTDEPTTIPCTNYINITETNYTFTPDYPTPCHKYVFTVIPVNGAGQGDSQNVAGYTINDLFPTIVVAIQAITSLGASQFQVTFRVTGDVESVCTVFLHGLYKSSQLLAKGENVSFTLPANIQYNTSFIITNAAIRSGIVSHIVFTTFDVQNVEAKATGSDIVITGIFAANSSALGYFLVLRDDIKISDTFKAVLRDGREESVSSSVTVPASTYTVLVYDLEHDALPNKNVAYQVAEAVTIRNGTDYTSTSDFNFTVTANISLIESVVYVTCDIPEEYSDISCVLVYREYGNKTLVVEEYSNNDEFSIHIPVNKSGGIYTFAVFGKNGSIIDEMPTTTVTYMVNAPMATLSPTTSMPHPTVAGPGEQDSSASVKIVAVIGSVLAVVLFMVALVFTILCIIRLLTHDKQGKLVFPHSPRKMEASSASVVRHVASTYPVETSSSSDTMTREDQRKVVVEQQTNAELPPPDAKEKKDKTTLTAPWPPASTASAVLLELSADTDTEVHREPSANTDSEVHKEPSANTDSEVHKEPSADADSEVQMKPSANSDLGNEPRADTDSKDQGHTRGVVYTQVVTLPAREQTIKPLFSLLTDTSFEYSVIKPHEAPTESSSATNEPVCEGSEHDCLPVSTHATGVGNTSVTEATVKENNEVDPVPVKQETNKERRETDQDSTSERKVHSGPGPVSEKSDTTFNKH